MKYKTIILWISIILPLFSLEAVADDSTTYNSVWNYNEEEQSFGFWFSLADEHKACPELRKELPMLHVYTKGKSWREGESVDNISIADTRFCTVWKKTMQIDCKSGTFSIHYNKDTNEYTGHYEIELLARISLFGSKIVKGDFKAQYCPPSPRYSDQ
jgi:hypothetical protein